MLRYNILIYIFISSLFGGKYLAVIDLEPINISNEEAKVFTQTLTSRVISLGNYIVVERANIDKILKEQKFQHSGCTNSECAVEIGQLLNADLTIIGSVGKVGQTYTIQTRIINVETGEALISADFTHKGEIDVLLALGIESIAHELLELPYQKRVTSTSSSYGASLDIKSEPAGAEIYIGGNYFEVSPLLLTDFPIGEYKVTLKLEGYEDYSKLIKLTPKGSHNITATLSAFPSYIRFMGFPSPADATIKIDGKRIEINKYQKNIKVPPGLRTIEILHDDYSTFKDTINIIAGKTQDFKYELKKVNAYLFFSGNLPTNAVNIHIDGIEKTIDSNGKIKVSEGVHSIRVFKNLYLDYQDTVIVNIDQTVNVEYILEDNVGFLDMKIKPSESRVWIDGDITIADNFIGQMLINNQSGNGEIVKTSNKIPIVPGNHSIMVEAPKYNSYFDEFEIKKNETTELNIELEKRFGHLNLQIKPFNATIYINDEPSIVNVSPSQLSDTVKQSFKLVPGTYNIRAEKYFHISKSTQARIYNNEYTDVKFILEPRSPKKARKLSWLFPGFGHNYVQSKVKGSFFLLLGVTTSFLAAHNGYDLFMGKTVNYNRAKENYLEATDPIDIERLRNIYKSRTDNRNMSIIRTVGFGTAYFTIWLWNIIDLNSIIPSDIDLKTDVHLNKKGHLEASFAF